MAVIMVMLVTNVTAQFYDFDTPFKIVKQDYFQEYMEYSFEKISNNYYKIHYEVTDPLFFEMVMCLDDTNCVNEIAKENQENVKNYDKHTSFLGIPLKYSATNFNNEYLGKDTPRVKADKLQFAMEKTFPIEKIGKDFSVYGYVMPEKQKGTLDVFIYNLSQRFYIKIGYDSTLIYFSLGEDSIEDSLGYRLGFLQNITNHIKISPYARIDSAYLSARGINTTKGHYQGISLSNEDMWGNTGSSTSCSGGSCSHSVTFYDDYLQLSVSCGSSSADSGCSGTAHAYANNTHSFPYLNITKDNSVAIYFTAYDYCYSSGKIGYGRNYLYFSNSSNVQINFFSQESYCSCARPCALTLTQTVNTFLIIEYNTTTLNATVRNQTRDILGEYDLSSLGNGDIFISAESTANKVWSGSEGVARGTAWNRLYTIGHDDTYADYSTFMGGNSYPANFSLNTGGYQSYINTTYLTDAHIINITANLTSAINSGACDCVGCYKFGADCYIPLTFSSEIGGGFNASNLEINFTYTASNLTINFVDTKTMTKLNWTNITVQVISDIYQTESKTDSGNVTLEIPFSSALSDTATIRAFSSDNTDYSIVQRVLLLQEGTTYNETIYLTNTSDVLTTQVVKFVAYNEDSLRIENALIKIYQQNPATNEYLLINEMYTNSQGEATTILVKDTVYYKFVVTLNDVEILVTKNPVPITSSDEVYNLYCVVGQGISQDYRYYSGLSLFPSWTYNSDDEGYFSLYYTSIADVEVCINITKNVNSVITQEQYLCINSRSYNIDFNAVSTLPEITASVNMYITADFGDGKIPVVSVTEYLGLDNISRQASNRLFVYLVLVILSGIVFIFTPNVGLLVFAIGNIILMISKFLYINNYAYMLIIGLTIFVMVTLNRNKQQGG
jgi:hypothetical protein